jgi:hypothetical protein
MMSPSRSTHPVYVRVCAPVWVTARGSPNQDQAPSPIGGTAESADPAAPSAQANATREVPTARAIRPLSNVLRG